MFNFFLGMTTASLLIAIMFTIDKRRLTKIHDQIRARHAQAIEESKAKTTAMQADMNIHAKAVQRVRLKVRCEHAAAQRVPYDDYIDYCVREEKRINELIEAEKAKLRTELIEG